MTGEEREREGGGMLVVWRVDREENLLYLLVPDNYKHCRVYMFGQVTPPENRTLSHRFVRQDRLCFGLSFIPIFSHWYILGFCSYHYYRSVLCIEECRCLMEKKVVTFPIFYRIRFQIEK